MKVLKKNQKHTKFNVNKKVSIVLMLFTFIMFSCSSDDSNPDPDLDPDVTYAKSIKSIIDGSCLDCHGSSVANGAPMSLTTFDEVKEAVQNRGLIGRVENGSMPPAGTDLTAAQVALIKAWETANFPQ